jgi:hypothetical protein
MPAEYQSTVVHGQRIPKSLIQMLGVLQASTTE